MSKPEITSEIIVPKRLDVRNAAADYAYTSKFIKYYKQSCWIQVIVVF